MLLLVSQLFPSFFILTFVNTFLILCAGGNPQIVGEGSPRTLPRGLCSQVIKGGELSAATTLCALEQWRDWRCVPY